MRHEHWPIALGEFIEARRFTPFVWGTSDCCLFAADAVQAITGVDYVPDYRGTYSDARGALALIQQAGGLSAFIPFEEVEPGFARRGDIVMVDMDGRQSLAIHLGSSIAGQGVDGLVFLTPDDAQRAWRVA